MEPRGETGKFTPPLTETRGVTQIQNLWRASFFFGRGGVWCLFVSQRVPTHVTKSSPMLQRVPTHVAKGTHHVTMDTHHVTVGTHTCYQGHPLMLPRAPTHITKGTHLLPSTLIHATKGTQPYVQRVPTCVTKDTHPFCQGHPPVPTHYIVWHSALIDMVTVNW